MLMHGDTFVCANLLVVLRASTSRDSSPQPVATGERKYETDGRKKNHCPSDSNPDLRKCLSHARRNKRRENTAAVATAWRAKWDDPRQQKLKSPYLLFFLFLFSLLPFLLFLSFSCFLVISSLHGIASPCCFPPLPACKPCCAVIFLPPSTCIPPRPKIPVKLLQLASPGRPT